MRINYESKGSWRIEGNTGALIAEGVRSIVITAPVEMRITDSGPNGGTQGWVYTEGNLHLEQAQARISPAS